MKGAMCSTPISALETATYLQSLEDRSGIKVLTQAAKLKRFTDHPMHSWMSMSTKGRWKRSSFIQQSWILKRQQFELLDYMQEPIQTHTAVPFWERQKFPTIFTRIPGIERKAAQSDPERKPITLEHNSANHSEWTHVYTDGSAIEATRDGDAEQKKRTSR